MPDPRSPATAAARAKSRRAQDRYLTPWRDRAGLVVGWRFTPSPTLRAELGLRAMVLKDEVGRFLDQAAARRERDRLIAAARGAPGAPGRQAAPVARDFNPSAPRDAPAAQRTLGNLWAAFDAHLAGPRANRSADTIRFYRTYIKEWLALGASDPVSWIEKPDLLDAWDTWSREGASARVNLARHQALQATLAYAEQIGWLPAGASPARQLRFKRPAPRARAATDGEIARLVEAGDAAGGRLALVATTVIAAVWTAQRQADLLACDLGRQLGPDPRTGRLHLFFRQGKTDAPVGPPLMPALAARLGGRTSGPLVPAPNGGRWNAHTFRHAFAELRATAGLADADLTFSDLRDTAITRLYKAGASALQIATWSGHSLKSVTDILKHYVQHDAETAAATGDQLAAWADQRGLKY